MKKNMSFKIIATVGLWAAIGLTACKAPQLSPDGERAVLPEGDGHTYDTAFVKPLEWNVFLRIPSYKDMWRSLCRITIRSSKAWNG